MLLIFCVACSHCTLVQLFFLHVHTYGCSREHQEVSLFSVMCTFEWLSLLISCACLFSPFDLCIVCYRCDLIQLFFVPVHTYGCLRKHQEVSLFSVMCTFKWLSLLISCACSFSPCDLCVVCCCDLIQPFFVHVQTYGCSLEHQRVSFFSVTCSFE